ncbi:adenylate/guanylate cyclase domain-containing protein [Nocardia pseudovaccinii]|uniref:adenylate/guanylate cyclase domain-containing protein n=1 Tax=Nocardia pseudovaccinii TaxID=189540 RepID=UPI0007A539B0|nr:adenylate/guanylate cyclase domain-containing protein [Nocardia pseudovaccinii]
MTAAPRYTAAQAAAAAGVPLARARRYWCALGYPVVDAADLEFTESDIEMLRMMTGFVAEGAVAEPDSLRLARVLSRSIAHLAQLQVEIVTSRSGANGIGRADAVRVLTDRTSEVQWLLGQIWRRQLGVAVAMPEADEYTSGVGFADIVDFTELSRDRSDIELTRLIARFEYRVTEIVVDRGGDVVKMLGDEVLFTADNAAALAHIATGLIAAFEDDADIRGLRVGLALGPVARHLGDVFGTTVNLASRLTVRTEPNSVLVAPAVAEALAGHPDFDLTALEPADIRGFDPMTPVLLRNKVS